jgi:hypothetical protein
MGLLYDIFLRRIRSDDGGGGGGTPGPHSHVIADILDLQNPLQERGTLALPADFPAPGDVVTGWWYRVTADVTDNDATKTNTGQSFTAGDEIYWNGTDWTVVGNGSGSDTVYLTAARNAIASNVYLRGPDGVVTNLSGFVLTQDMTIVGLAAGTNGPETWVAEIRKNGVAAVITSISMTAEAKKVDTTMSVDVDQADELQVYCNGSGINRPHVVIELRRR